MENLIVGSVSNSPVKTLEKNKIKSKFLLKHLTSSLPLNSDQIFKMMSNNNTEILENITVKNKISDDKNCGYFSMSRKTKHCYNNRCKGCQLIYRLIKTVLLESELIEIYYGKKKGKKIKIQTFDYFKSDYMENSICRNLNLYISKEIKSLQCNINMEKEVEFFSTKNKYYNFVIISIILNKLLLEKEIFLYNSFLWSFVCRNRISLICLEKEYKSVEDLVKNPYYSNYSSPIITKIVNKNLSSTTVINILKQLIIILNNLLESFFIHSEPSIKYINYSSETVTLPFKDGNITFPFKLSLTPCYTSSINYNKKRFFLCKDIIKNYGLPVEKIDIYFNKTKNYLKKNKKIFFDEEYEKNRIFGYKIGNRSEIFLQTIKNNGVPLFNESFEFICFLVSYIIDKNFLFTFKECKKEFQTWKGLWKEEEFPLLMKDIAKSDINDFKRVLDIVKKYYIRFDSLEYFYREL